MCECMSDNGHFGSVAPVKLDDVYFGSDEDIWVDSCISTQIEALWMGGVWTLGCCCGHNRRKPDVVVDRFNAKKAVSILKSVDPDRDWRVCSWVLMVSDDSGSPEVPLGNVIEPDDRFG